MDIKSCRIREDGVWETEVVIVNADLWERVKSGQITGLSIGSTGIRVPVFPWYVRAWRWVVRGSVRLWWRARGLFH